MACLVCDPLLSGVGEQLCSATCSSPWFCVSPYIGWEPMVQMAIATSETLSPKEAFPVLGCFLSYLAKVTKRNWLKLFHCQHHASRFNCWLKDAVSSLTSFSRAFCAAVLFIDTVHESLWICRFIYSHTHPRPFYDFHSYVQETSASFAQLRSFLV